MNWLDNIFRPSWQRQSRTNRLLEQLGHDIIEMEIRIMSKLDELAAAEAAESASQQKVIKLLESIVNELKILRDSGGASEAQLQALIDASKADTAAMDAAEAAAEAALAPAPKPAPKPAPEPSPAPVTASPDPEKPNAAPEGTVG